MEFRKHRQSKCRAIGNDAKSVALCRGKRFPASAHLSKDVDTRAAWTRELQYGITSFERVKLLLGADNRKRHSLVREAEIFRFQKKERSNCQYIHLSSQEALNCFSWCIYNGLIFIERSIQQDRHAGEVLELTN